MKFWSRLKVYLTRPKKPTAYERIQAQAEERGRVHTRAEALAQKLVSFARQATDLTLTDVAQVFIDMLEELALMRKAVLAELENLNRTARENIPEQADKTAVQVAALRSHVENTEARLRTIPPPGQVRRTNTVDDGRLVRANFKLKPR